MKSVIGRGAMHSAAGAVIGVAAAWFLAMLVEPFLFQVRAVNPVIALRVE
jgi:hypothetical protein